VNGIVLTSAPAGEPITLAEAKAWLRVDGTEEDVLISALIEAARTHVENFTRRALVTQSIEVSFDAFPTCGRFARALADYECRGGVEIDASREIQLPRPPLVSVESLKYYDTDGTLQTFAAAGYHVDTRAQPGRIVLNEDYDWPDTQVRPNAVIVAYTAGYGTPSQIPQALRVAIRFLLSHWFENRTHINIGNIVNAIPDTVETLLWQHRLPGAY
jgi:hypothetical protein